MSSHSPFGWEAVNVRAGLTATAEPYTGGRANNLDPQGPVVGLLIS